MKGVLRIFVIRFLVSWLNVVVGDASSLVERKMVWQRNEMEPQTKGSLACCGNRKKDVQSPEHKLNRISLGQQRMECWRRHFVSNAIKKHFFPLKPRVLETTEFVCQPRGWGFVYDWRGGPRPIFFLVPWFSPNIYVKKSKYLQSP